MATPVPGHCRRWRLPLVAHPGAAGGAVLCLASGRRDWRGDVSDTGERAPASGPPADPAIAPGQPEVRASTLGRIGIMICMDAGYFEPARLLALAGADVLCFPTNWLDEKSPGSRRQIKIAPQASSSRINGTASTARKPSLRAFSRALSTIEFARASRARRSSSRKIMLPSPRPCQRGSTAI